MTKIYQFSLQKVLDLRQMIEETKTVALRNSQRVLKKEKDKLENLEVRKDTVLDRGVSSDKGQTTLSLNNLQVAMDYVVQLNDMISNQIQEVEKSNELVEKDRDDLLEASKNKKIVEKLNEHQWMDYLKNYRKRESKRESEIAIRVATKSNAIGSGQ